ncbi:MAG TPA: hypothetical protein VFR01_03935 [Geobacterales bacterium]|nr:hypothetical protein [Geobacterales bacterium]
MELAKETAKTLTWFSLLALGMGLLIPSPAGTLFGCLVAFLPAAVAFGFGRSRQRLLAGLALVAIIAVTVSAYGDFRTEYDAYRARVRSHRSPGGN